jgi:hypothetical protein
MNFGNANLFYNAEDAQNSFEDHYVIVYHVIEPIQISNDSK